MLQNETGTTGTRSFEGVVYKEGGRVPFSVNNISLATIEGRAVCSNNEQSTKLKNICVFARAGEGEGEGEGMEAG